MPPAAGFDSFRAPPKVVDTLSYMTIDNLSRKGTDVNKFLAMLLVYGSFFLIYTIVLLFLIDTPWGWGWAFLSGYVCAYCFYAVDHLTLRIYPNNEKT